MTNDINVWSTTSTVFTHTERHRDNEIFSYLSAKLVWPVREPQPKPNESKEGKWWMHCNYVSIKCINSFVVHAQTHYTKHCNCIHHIRERMNTWNRGAAMESLAVHVCTCTSITFDFNLLNKIAKMNADAKTNNRMQMCKLNRNMKCHGFYPETQSIKKTHGERWRETESSD